jgi:hypothetical protein
LAGLSEHTDLITGFTDLFDGLYEDGRGDFIKFAGSYIGKDINDTPGVWTYLRDTMVRRNECYVSFYEKDPNPLCNNQRYYGYPTNYSGKYGDYDYYLYRPERLEGNATVPVKTDELPSGTKTQIYNWGLPDSRYGYPTVNQYVGRKSAPGNRYMSFDIDDGYRYDGLLPRTGLSYDVRIVFLDDNTGYFKFQYKNGNNQWVEKRIDKTATKLWKEVAFTVNDAYFNNNASEGSNASLYPTDFRLDFESMPTVIHLIEVRGKGDVVVPERPKAQVSVDLVRNEGDDPKEGIFSVRVGDTIKVKARLTDNEGRPLANERVMFTYNTEWNHAASVTTNQDGVAYYTLSTANRTDSSGFWGADGSRTDKPSWYTVQAFYPGNSRYQPSRNDALLLVTNSTGPNDPSNVRLRITNVDLSSASATGTVAVTYQALDNSGAVIETKTEALGKSRGFYADDPNAQTVALYYITTTRHAAFNNVTVRGVTNAIPSNPQGLTIVQAGQ